MHNTMNKIVGEILEKDTRRKREATVSVVQQLATNMRRITLSGDDVDKFLDDLRAYEPACWIKVFFPWKESLAGRAYTISGINKANRTIDIDMVLHGEGPASRWAQQALVGDKLGFAGPCSGGYKGVVDASWLLLLGDETALPAKLSILDSLTQPIPVFWFAEVGHEQEIRRLDYPYLITNSWQVRDRYYENVMNSPLVKALNRCVLPSEPGQVWLACEQQVAVYLKNHFINERMIPKTSLFAKGYWKKGESNFKGNV